MIETTSKSFSTADLAKLTGLDFSTLQKWHRKGIAPATLIRGTKGTSVLSYSEEQAAAVLVLVDLHTRGFHWKIIRRIADFLPRPLSRYRYLIADKKIIEGHHTATEAIDGMLSLANLALVVETEAIIAKLGSGGRASSRMQR